MSRPVVDTIPLESGWVDLERRAVVRGDAQVELRAREVALLRYLAARPGHTVPREELFAEVWGYHPGTRSRTLDTTVRRLRAALEVEPASPRHLLTEVGVGYRFVGCTDACERFLRDGAERIVALGSQRVVLSGPPGVGKRRWANEAAAAFDGQVVRASGPEVVRAIGITLGVDPSGDPARVRGRIEDVRAARRVLLVLHDVPIDEVLRWAPPLCAVTTANPEPDPRFELVAVEPLPRDAARDLLVRTTPLPLADPDVERLLDLLGGLPLAIELAAAQLPFCSPSELVRALGANPERLYDTAPDTVTRAAIWARARLDPRTRASLDTLSFYAGPVPVAILTEAAGGVGCLARLRDQGWLVAEPNGRWSVPASLRIGADPSGRARAAAALVSALSAGCDPLWGPTTWEMGAELVSLVPTLRALAEEPRVRVFLVWALAIAGEPAEAASVANTLQQAEPLVWAQLGTAPPEVRLAVIAELPPNVARDAVRCRLLRRVGHLEEAEAIGPPSEAEGPAAGELWHQLYYLAHIRGDFVAGRLRAGHAIRAWRRQPRLQMRARAAMAHVALLCGHLSRAEQEFVRMAATAEPAIAYEGQQGLMFLSLLRGEADRAAALARELAPRIGTLADPTAIVAWHQLALVWRELGDIERVEEATTAGLLLAEASGGPVLLVSGLHSALGTALVEAGRHGEAIAELCTAREALGGDDLVERRVYVDLFELVARELRGEEVSERWSTLTTDSPPSRVSHLVAAAAGGPPDPLALAFADQTYDPGLRGFIEALAGQPLPEAVARCSFEARVGLHLGRHRCHTGSHR